MYALVAALNLTPSFHLVGHDHGAALGWYTAAEDKGSVLSYAALSVPHLDAFNAGLFGPTADVQQQIASQVVLSQRKPPSSSSSP